MVNQQSTFDSIVQDSRLGKTPPNCRSVELHVSPTTLADLVLKDNVGHFKGVFPFQLLSDFFPIEK